MIFWPSLQLPRPARKGTSPRVETGVIGFRLRLRSAGGPGSAGAETRGGGLDRGKVLVELKFLYPNSWRCRTECSRTGIFISPKRGTFTTRRLLKINRFLGI